MLDNKINRTMKAILFALQTIGDSRNTLEDRIDFSENAIEWLHQASASIDEHLQELRHEHGTAMR